MLLVPALTVAPFYVYQFAQTRGGIPTDLDAHEVNFQAGTMLSNLQKISGRSFSEQGIATKFGEVLRRLGTSADVPPAWLGASTICAAVLLLASVRRRLALPLVIPTLIVGAIWYRVTSYDIRNLLPVLPVAAVLATAGAIEIRSMVGHSRFVAAFAVAGSVMLAVLIGRVFLVRAATMSFQPSLSSRVAGMKGEADERIRLFFPSEWPTYSWVKSLGPSAAAEHVIATAHMYRWFRSGTYPASLWNSSSVRPGDIYIGSPPWRPPSDEQWTLLRDTDGFKVWILDVNPRIVPLSDLVVAGVRPPSITASSAEMLTFSANGPQGFVGQRIVDRNLRNGSSIVWQALVDARDVTSAVRPGFSVSDAAVVDQQRTGVAVDMLPGDQQLATFSGILTLSGTMPSDLGIVIGIESVTAGATVHLRRLRVAIYN